MTPAILDRDCEYDSIDAVNISRLLLLQKSPLHFRAAPKKITKPMAIGTAAHAATLEPDRFAAEFIVWQNVHPEGAVDSKGKPCGGKRRVRSGKEWEAFEAEAGFAGYTILTAPEHEAAVRIAAACHADRIAGPYIRSGHPERVLTWTDRRTGVSCKGRTDLDGALGDGAFIADLKTTADITPRAFARSAARLSYHARMAWYSDGYETITGEHPLVLVFAVESVAPHDVVVYEIDEDVLQLGREEYGRLLDLLVECRRTGEWPGIGGGQVKRYEVPKWLTEDEDDLSALDLEDDIHGNPEKAA